MQRIMPRNDAWLCAHPRLIFRCPAVREALLLCARLRLRDRSHARPTSANVAYCNAGDGCEGSCSASSLPSRDQYCVTVRTGSLLSPWPRVAITTTISWTQTDAGVSRPTLIAIGNPWNGQPAPRLSVLLADQSHLFYPHPDAAAS